MNVLFSIGTVMTGVHFFLEIHSLKSMHTTPVKIIQVAYPLEGILVE